MVKLRLTRMGAKKKPFYRVVVADSRVQRDGRWIEQIGYYDPMREPYVLKIDLERVDHWLSHGAQATETVGHLIARARAADVGEDGIVRGAEKAPKAAPPAPKPEAKVEAAAEAAPAAAEEAPAAEPEAAAEPAADEAEA